MREKIISERRRRLEYINELQMEMTQLEAELRIAQEEFDANYYADAADANKLS